MTRLTLTFLGTFSVLLDDQPVTRFRSANNQGLLIYLALHQEQAVPREVLAALFWPDETDKTARSNLRQALYHLRKLLGDTKNGDPPFLIVTRHTVQLNPQSDTLLDVYQFLTAIEKHDLPTAVTHYHGELLPGFTCDSLPFEEWLRQERESLHHLALEAMFEAGQDQLRRGSHEQAQKIARRQLSLEPWHEPAHRQLMQAYALAGDRASALAQYEQCRALLWQELAVEPSSETTVLYEAIKTGNYSPLAAVEMLRPPAKDRHNLPASTTPLIGRELDLAQIDALLLSEKQRLVTIVGPGGMGKTRLALAAGANLLPHYEDGVYFVDLAPLNHPREIMTAIALALEFQAPDKSADLGPQLLATLRHRRLLLILDNFEHLQAGVSLVNEILQTCPQLSLLITSRQRLNLASESRYELGGLHFPQTLTPADALAYTAVQLFVSSGRRAQPNFALNPDNMPAVVRICQFVQGMPLGLLLAAAWLELLTPAEIIAEMEQSLDFLAADLADLPPRQRSIEIVFAGSWELMTPAEQHVLANLSVFRGSFSRQAAEQVAGANLRLLLALVHKSLLQRRRENGRFTMQELLRQFAAAKRQQLDPADQLSLAHTRYFAGLVKDEIERTLGFHPIQLPQQLMADRDNIGHAWTVANARGSAAEIQILAQGVVAFAMAQGIKPEAIPRRSIEALQERGVPDTDPALLHLRLLAINCRIGIDEPVHIHQDLLELLPLVKQNNDPELLFWTYERLANVTYDVFYELQPVSVMSDRAYQAALATGDERLIKMAGAMALSFRVEVRLARADDFAQLLQLLAYFEKDYPQSSTVFDMLRAASRQYLLDKDFEQALNYARRCLRIAHGWRDLFWITLATDRLATIYLQMDRPDQAGKQILDALEWHLAIGQVWQTLGNIWGKCIGYRRIMGDLQHIVPILAMVYHHPEVVPFHRHQIDEIRPQLAAEMGTAAFNAAWQQGQQMDLDTAVAQIRHALSPEGENVQM